MDSNTEQPIVQPLTTETQRPRKRKGRALLIAGIICLVLVGAGIGAWLLLRPASVSCLTDADYEALTGTAAQGDVSPKDNFYTQSVEFMNDSDAYTQESKAATEEFIQRVGDFYKKRSNSTSIVITIHSDYVDVSSAAVAEQRAAKLKQALQESGVDVSAIKTAEPQPILPEDEAETEQELPASISVTSDSQCR